MGNKIKRRSLFSYFKDKNLDAVVLQETHTTGHTTKLWQKEWGGPWIHSSGMSNVRGVTIMFNKNCKIEIIDSKHDHEGRFVVCNVKKENVQYTLCNVYAPNNDNPKFFKSMFNVVQKQACENTIVGGDFNFVFNPMIDRSKAQKQFHNNDKSKLFVNNVMEEMSLCDIWRECNESLRRYTWFKKHLISTASASRIDFFLKNVGLNSKITNINVTDYL